MKTYRERFIKNHRQDIQIAQNKKGYRKVLTYIGDYYTWEPPKGSITFTRRLVAILEALTLILLVICSIPGSVISYSPYVMSGAILAFVTWVFEIFGTFSFCFRPLPLQEDDYAYIRMVYRITPPIRCALLLFSTVTGFLCLRENGFETLGFLDVIGYLLTALIAIYLFIRFLQLAKYVKIIPGSGSSASKK